MSEPIAPSPAETLLNNVRVASPCRVSWDEMAGGDRVRSCAHCQRKVYNLSQMPAADAADLLRTAEGELCVRFFRRTDGTVMTRDCPVGMQAVRMRIAKGISVAFVSLLTVCGMSLANKPRAEYPVLLRLLLDRVAPEPPPAPLHVMGEMRQLPMAPSAPRVLPGIAPVRGVVVGKMTMGAISLPARPVDPTEKDTASATTDPTTSDKPFLRGVEVPMQEPRADPFAPQRSIAHPSLPADEQHEHRHR